MPVIRLPPGVSTQSTATSVTGAAASFFGESERVDVFIGARMNNPLSYHDHQTTLAFYPPPTIYKATSTISVIIGETVTLTIKVSQLYSYILTQMHAQGQGSRSEPPYWISSIVIVRRGLGCVHQIWQSRRYLSTRRKFGMKYHVRPSSRWRPGGGLHALGAF